MNYIGIDAGGTKTSFILYNDKGEVLNQITKPTIHILHQDKNLIIKYLKEALEYLDKDGQAIISLGMAGYGKVKTIREEIESVCKEAFKNRKYYIYSDIEIATIGALNYKDGIVVISGTGSIALSVKDNQYKRVGGWGNILGDEGSAYYIALELFKTYCKQVDGRLHKTKLYSYVKETLQLKDDYDLISFINHKNRSEIASYAKLNYELALTKDQYALDIYNKAGNQIYHLIKPLLKDFNKKVTISYIGGVFKADEYILKPLKKILEKENVEIIKPIYSPEYGAYLLAKGESYE